MKPSELPVTRYPINIDMDFLKFFSPIVSIEGKNCLCIGYDEAQLNELVLKYRPEKIRLLTIWADHKDARVTKHPVEIGDISKRTPYADNYFDFVLTLALLEHIADLEGAFKEISRILKPDGWFASFFGPAWSCAVGNHIYHRPGHPIFDFCQWKLPSHIHLLCSPEEIWDYYLKMGCTNDECRAILHWYYSTPIINRIFFEDYMTLFYKYFNLISMSTMWIDVEDRLYRELRIKYPRYHDFVTYGGKFLLRNRK